MWYLTFLVKGLISHFSIANFDRSSQDTYIHTSLELVCPVSSSLSAKMLGILIVMPVLLGLLTDSPQTKRRVVSQDYAEKVTMGGCGFGLGIGGVLCVVIMVLEIGCVSVCEINFN